MSYPTIGDIAAALERWANPSLAASYDNSGLQVGDARRTVKCALIALDLTPAVLREARRREATLVVSHHPLLFHPLRQLTPDAYAQGLALRLAEERIALYSIHTNLDAAPGGVSHALAGVLGLREIRFLEPMAEDEAGYGAVGAWPEAKPLDAFLRHVCHSLGAASLRYAGRRNARISRVAVCGGAGAGLIGAAMAAGVDAFVSADIRYHQFFDVLDADGEPSMVLVDAGHYETEAHTETLLHAWLKERFPSVAWHRTESRTSPVHAFFQAPNSPQCGSV